MGGFGDDIDYDQLEDYLDNLPSGPRYKIVFQSSGWKMRRLARQLKRQKKHAVKSGKDFSVDVTLDAHRPGESVGGWFRSDTLFDEQDVSDAREFMTKYFAPKGLTVGTINAGWYGMAMGANGNYNMLQVGATIT